MNAPPSDPPWRTKRREKIISAASGLFARAPYDVVQMDDIARRAGLGKPTLYRYFASKEELYLSVCEEAFRKLDAQLDAAATADSPTEALRHMVRALVEGLSAQLSALAFLHGEDSSVTSQWRQLYCRRRRMITDRLRHVLERGVARGEFTTVNPVVAPQLLLGAIRGGLIDTASVPREKLVQTLTAFVLQGLAAARSPADSTDLSGTNVELLPTRAWR